MELMDYLKWRNDVSLRAAPFNEIDNVLLSYLAYADFGELLHEPKRHVSIETCFKRFCEKHDLAEVRESKHFIERAPLLLEDMVCGARFRGTKVAHFREVFDKEKVQQFAALVFLLPDGTKYVSFRGTDSSITGWKEDFLMSFTAEIERTKEADRPGGIPGRSGLQADRRTGNKFIMRGTWLHSKEKEEIIMTLSMKEKKILYAYGSV